MLSDPRFGHLIIRIVTARGTEVLFAPLRIRHVPLANRIVMAPMTRSFSPEGVPGDDVAAYYRRRAENGVGLIITEGIYPPHAAAGFDPRVPRLSGGAALEGWRRVVREVHGAGGRIFAQIWHVGLQVSGGPGPPGDFVLASPTMAGAEIEAVVEAYADAARNAQAAGFDGVEIHGAHGYLIDQFFWDKTNRRDDRYGGDLVRRTRFASEVIAAIRRAAGPEYPISFRFSQWKIGDYEAKLAESPAELELFLAPLVAAGVDVFHCSTRRFGDPEFAGSALGLAGWTRKLTGKPVIAVGSVSLDADVMTTFGPQGQAGARGIDDLLERMDRAEFDLIAVGRALLANPDWAGIVRRGAFDELQPFRRESLTNLW
jgi:2,4-dienoyl-CoA reductase-like NADH-dependent reductase (Old Yellow Enzyme family)